MNALTDPAHSTVVLTTVAVVSLIIGLHYEVLRNCIRLLPALARRRRLLARLEHRSRLIPHS